MATRCARSAAIRPMPRSVSSGRSPAVPMIAVIGAARPAAPAAIPWATSRTAADARLVVGEVDDHDLGPDAIEVEPPGRPFGARREVDQAVADLLDRGAQAARPAGGRERVGHVVAGQPADRDRDARRRRRSAVSVVAVRLDDDALAHEVGAPAALAMPPNDGRRLALEREQGDRRPDPPGHRRDERVVGVEHDPAVGLA